MRDAIRSTPARMVAVSAAMLPGIAAMTWVWGPGVLVNVGLLLLFSAGVEVVCLAARHGRHWRVLRPHMTDASVVVTALTLAICLPPHVSPWLLLLASAASVGLAKHAYGGLGRNIFNPAMVGFAVLLVSFPQALDHWPAVSQKVDALSGATQLSEFRYRTGITTAEFESTLQAALNAQARVAAAFCLGGLVLIYFRIIHWRIPMSMLGGLGLAAIVGYDQGSSESLGSWWFHATSGGFVAAAFFVATDPVTHPRHPRDQVIFGLSIGIAAYLMRAYSAYPDGIAFAVLLANAFAPLLNHRRTQAQTAPTA